MRVRPLPLLILFQVVVAAGSMSCEAYVLQRGSLRLSGGMDGGGVAAGLAQRRGMGKGSSRGTNGRGTSARNSDQGGLGAAGSTGKVSAACALSLPRPRPPIHPSLSSHCHR